MNKGLLAILAAAALAATKNVSSGTGSFGKKRNKSLEKFDRDVQNILTSLGAKKDGVSLFEAYKRTQSDMGYAESCHDCPQAYAYAALMLSILVNLDGYSVPSDYLVKTPENQYREQSEIELTGEDIEEVFAFESTARGKKFSDSLMWKIESWFLKVQSELDMMKKDQPDMASEINDSTTQELISETLNAYAMIADPKLKPNYVGPGILSMGITGYFLVQYIKLFVAIPGDKNIMSVLNIIIDKQAEKARVDSRYISIFSHSHEEDEGELPFLFGNNIFISMYKSKLDRLIKDKKKILNAQPERNRLFQITSRELLRLERKQKEMMTQYPRHLLPTTIRDRFLSEFNTKNRRTNEIVIKSSATKILDSLKIIARNEALNFDKLYEHMFEVYKSLFKLESKVNDELYVLARMDSRLPSHDPDIPLRDMLLEVFETRNSYQEDVLNLQLTAPFAIFTAQIGSMKKILGIRPFTLNFVRTADEDLSYYNNVRGKDEVTLITTDPDPISKLQAVLDYEENPSLDNLMDERSEQVFLQMFGITKQELHSDEWYDRFEQWDDNNWTARDADLTLIWNEDITEEYVIAVVMRLLFSEDKRKVNSLSEYLLLLSDFQIQIKEKSGGSLEDGMILYASEKASLLSTMIENAIGQIDGYRQAAAQQANRILLQAQENRIANALRAQQIRLAEQQKRKKLVVEYGLGYSVKPLSTISSSDFIVLDELDNSIALEDYNSMDQSSLTSDQLTEYQSLRPLKTIFVEYLEPSILISIRNTTPGALCVGSVETSYMEGLKRGSQRHFGVLVQTSKGNHVAFHSHSERGRITKDKFTSKWNTAGFPFVSSLNPQVLDSAGTSLERSLRYNDLLSDSQKLMK